MKNLHMISFFLVIVGGINWLCMGFGFNLVEELIMMVAGSNSSGIVNLVYILVGLSAVWLILEHKDACNMCCDDMSKGKKKK